jgi:hypothetical protein
MDNGKHWRDNYGRFKNGNPGKPHGATRNKLRDQIKNFVNEQWDFLPEWFSALTPKEKVNALTELLPYCIARLQSISITETPDPSQPPREMDMSKLSDDELRTLIALQNKLFGNDKNSHANPG